MSEEVAEKKEETKTEGAEAGMEPVKVAAAAVAEVTKQENGLTSLTTNGKVGSVMVLGAGIAGIQAALDLAEMGFKVYLVEEKSSIGGVMPQLDKTFPTNDCAMCLLSPKLVDAGRHPNIEIITNAQLEKVSGQAGRFTVDVKKKPRFVDEEKCTGCGVCVENCPVRNVAQRREEAEVKLSEDDLRKIEDILEQNKGGQEKLVPLLQDINLRYRYLPENILKYISQILNVPLSHIYNLATFYNAFSLTPRGRCTIRVCLGTACHVKGGQRLVERLERDLGIKPGETTEDLNFSLEAVHCLGCCGLAPVVTVGDDLYGKIGQAKLPGIIEKYK